MKILNSIRFRISIAFAAFALALCIAYGFGMWWTMAFVEDRVFHERLEQEIAEFKTAVAIDKTARLPHDRYLKSYLGRDSLPSSLERLVTHTEGIVEYRDGDLYVAATPHNNDTLFLVQDVRDLEVFGDLGPKLIIISIIVGFIAVAIALWLGRAVASRMIAPVTSLADLFRDRKPNALPHNFASDYYDDEIGFLARTLEDQVQRIEDFVEHEVRFSRDASHELRTPVTSIKLALDLISASPDAESPLLKKPLERIRRANSDMEHLIVTLLWLSRERRKLERAGPVVGPEDEALALINQCVEAHRSIIDNKPVTIHVNDDTTRSRLVHRDLFSIAAGNLIRNAFQYTDDGDVTITLSDDAVTVIDSGRGLSGDKVQPSAPRGFGFGLDLVRRICHRCGWKLSVQDEEPQGTRAMVSFGDT